MMAISMSSEKWTNFTDRIFIAKSVKSHTRPRENTIALLHALYAKKVSACKLECQFVATTVTGFVVQKCASESTNQKLAKRHCLCVIRWVIYIYIYSYSVLFQILNVHLNILLKLIVKVHKIHLQSFVVLDVSMQGMLQSNFAQELSTRISSMWDHEMSIL